LILIYKEMIDVLMQDGSCITKYKLCEERVQAENKRYRETEAIAASQI
jgi:hypothetical protein